MKELITTIRNIFKIDDLRIRILNTVVFLLVYRLGAHIVMPDAATAAFGVLRIRTPDRDWVGSVGPSRRIHTHSLGEGVHATGS